MEMTFVLVAKSAAVFAFTIVVINLLARGAHLVGHVDSPTERKLHEGSIPIVGGIAVFVSLLTSALLWSGDGTSAVTVKGADALWVFVACSGFLVLTGALDDRFDLGVSARVAGEVAVALVVIELLNLRLADLGNLFGGGPIRLPEALSYPFTIIAIFGIINAFNMLDGMDGLLASLVLATLIIFHFFTRTQPELITLCIGSALMAFLVSNLQLSPMVTKTFLGDAGSRLLGFLVVCLLLGAASGQVGSGKIIKPVTALYLVALPLFDMVFTTTQRAISGKSPFAADRRHIHHLVQRLGFSKHRSLVLIVGVSIALNIIGLIFHRLAISEPRQLAIFFALFGLYWVTVRHCWLITEKPNSGLDQ